MKSELSFQRRSQGSCQKIALQPGRAGRQQDSHRNQAATGSETGFPPTPHLPGFCHTAPEAGWLLGIYVWKEYGWVLQAYQDRHYVIKSSQQWECLEKTHSWVFWVLWDSLVNQIAMKVPDIKRFTCRFNQHHLIKIKISISRYSSIFLSQEMLNIYVQTCFLCLPHPLVLLSHIVWLCNQLLQNLCEVTDGGLKFHFT